MPRIYAKKSPAFLINISNIIAITMSTLMIFVAFPEPKQGQGIPFYKTFNFDLVIKSLPLILSMIPLTFMPLRKMKRKKLKKQFPDKPWFWEPDWQKGKVKPVLYPYFVFPIILCLIFITLMIVYVPVEYQALHALLGCAIAVTLLIGIRESIRFFNQYMARCDVKDVPIIPGTTMRSFIYLGHRAIPTESIQITLTCIEHALKVRSFLGTTKQRVLYKLTKKKGECPVFHSAEGTIVPLQATIPDDLPQTRTEDEAYNVAWLVEVVTPSFWGTRKITFQIPVFRLDD
jgi:hypothetical protein